MIHLPKSLAAWGGADFNTALKQEIEQMEGAQLPLQAGLSRSSYATGKPHTAVTLGAADDEACIRARVGIFYTGVIAGCNCADDPTPMDEENEYCEVQVSIDKRTGEATVSLLREDGKA